MTIDQLIREAFAAEADRAVDAEVVRAELARARRPRRTGLALVAAAVAIVAVVVAAVVTPKVFESSSTKPPVGAAPVVDQNVLLVGLDGDKRADSMMLAHVGADGFAAAVSLPRDTWVGGKLNSVYRDGGIEQLIATVHKLTGVRADHYAIVEMAGLAELADVVGGVPVCLRQATSDPLSGAVFPAGEQMISGAQALAFLRQRHDLPDGDLDRVARHQVFLRGLAGRLDDADLATVLEVVRKRVKTDPDWDLLAFAERVRDLDPEQIRVATIPIRGEQDGSLIVDPAEVSAFVKDVFAGGPVSEPDPGRAPDSDLSCVA